MDYSIGFSFIGKRIPFALRQDMAFTTLSLDIPGTLDKMFLLDQYLEDCIVPLAQINIINSRECSGDYYNAR